MKHAVIAMLCLMLIWPAASLMAQDAAAVLTEAEAAKIVPSGFYFQGQSAPTQARNSAVARLGQGRHVIAGLVDTAGYTSDVREKYIGFLIVDSPVTIGDGRLATGAYGFGFTSDGKMNIFDVGGKPVLAVAVKTDRDLKRPRPLMMARSDDGIRLYHGKEFVVLK